MDADFVLRIEQEYFRDISTYGFRLDGERVNSLSDIRKYFHKDVRSNRRIRRRPNEWDDYKISMMRHFKRNKKDRMRFLQSLQIEAKNENELKELDEETKETVVRDNLRNQMDDIHLEEINALKIKVRRPRSGTPKLAECYNL